ncbi:RNA polymerase II transcription elongation factor [Striga hermonthica]|uniref:RNA polymerase II transcription elongation factor n=1 Tax=Striga hermonthica TaxID=68872 RepID=A0A9N7P451_STRHE|nr:RNA polymerase II transcription elongation factor [Striga hermonthica]
MAGINNTNEPSTAPQADRWYNLTLGSSFKDHNPSKFRTFRYEFKPASIDKNQHGTLHKSKDNKVTVEFQNIQPGKPKMIFEGTSEDYKDSDAVLFFDGESFRLERLHSAVKRLRHNRMLSESAGLTFGPAGPSEASSPPVGKGVKHQLVNKEIYHPAPVEVERIEIGNFRNSDPKVRADETVEHGPTPQPNPSPDPKKDDDDDDLDLDLDLHLDIMNDDEEDNINNSSNNVEGSIEVKEIDFDINVPAQQANTDDEIADVDVNDDEGGPNAAEALRLQVMNAQERQSSSSGSSSGGSDSSESGSGSGSASSASGSGSSESSDADSVNSI